MKTISRYIMTLALLLTAVTGAWADYTVTWEGTTLQGIAVKNNTATTSQTVEGITVTASNGYFFYDTNYPQGPVVQASSSADNGLVFSAENNIKSIAITFTEMASYDGSMAIGAGAHTYQVSPAAKSFALPKNDSFTGITKVVFTLEGDAPVAGPEVSGPTIVEGKPQWTFSMPGSDVVLTPIYAKAAAFATTGTEPDVKTLLPEAAEGVIAGTDASLIAEGTGIVAFAAASTDVKQGTLMYAIGTSATQAPALTEFNATVPTAEDVADDGADVYVWYYIKGADAPDGQQATEENTFNDTEPACLTVTVLSNKFDIQFNAANANTIEAGKATVTVGGAAATVTDGKLQGVKMGSEVKLKANTGYKLRKVEVKKKAAEPVADIVWDVTNVSDLRVQGDFLTYEKEGVTLSGNAGNMEVNWVNFGDPTTDGISFVTNESGGFTFTAPTGKAFTKIEMKALGSYDWAQVNIGTGWEYFGDDTNKIYKVTWTGSAASTVKLLTGTDNFFGDYISSIAFYLSE